MLNPKSVYPFGVVLLSVLIAACSFAAADTSQPPDIETTVIAYVEATLAANPTVIAQRVQATLTAIADETDTALALLPTSTPTDKPTATPTPTSVPMNTALPSPEAEPTEIPEPTLLVTIATTAYRVSSGANLRSGPGTNYAVVGALQAGEPFSIIARTEDGSWFQIETATGAQAWVAVFLVESPPDLGSVPVASVIPEAPTPAPIVPVLAVEQQAVADNTGQRLDVAFRNPHYNCDRDSSYLRVRYFQIDLFITNTSSEAVGAPWSPTRWIIGDGNSTRESTDMRQWCSRFSGCYPQPPVLPGGSEGWTWITGDLALTEWVQAVEWEYNGQLYRQEFENNAINRSEWNYRACQ